MRTEFTTKVKLARWEFAKGNCEICKCKIIGGAEYDHSIPWEFSNDSSFSNCECLCKKCHRLKTSTKDIPDIAKAKRREAKFIGAKRPKQKIQSRGFRQQPNNTKYINLEQE